jgi:iron complex outermembrane receptor protein
MKKKYLLFVITLFICNYIFSQVVISGKVTDRSTNEALAGATVFIPDLQSGAITKDDGTYTIKSLPKGKFLLQIKFIGYATITQYIDLSINSVLNFALEPSVCKEKEIVITGSAISSDNNRSSVSVVTVAKDDLITSAATNVINALTSIPGVSEITTGSGVSKPVIRGLAYNHVVVLNEGIRQEGNQWGPEHGMEIDQFSPERIEILKGPASLFYGSDALGGVINVLEPAAPSSGTIRGELSSDYSTNNKLTANSLMFEGNHNGFIWAIRGTYKRAASFQTPAGYVYNSGFNENNYSAVFGLHKKWGFTHLHISQFNAFIGAVDGTRDSLTNQFVDANGNIVSSDQLKSRKLELPFNNVQHTKITSVSNIIINGSQLKINVGYQTNHRKEFDDNTNTPNVYFSLNTLTYDAKLLLPVHKGFETAFGLSGMTQTNENKGNEYVVPNYLLQDIGGFAYIKKSINKFTVNAGLRYDHRNINGKPLNLDSLGTPISSGGDTIFQTFKSSFQAISGAVGFTYSFSKKVNIKLNIGRGYRAPNIYELATSMNGAAPDPGTFCFNAGNYDLKPETSIQIDGEITANTKYVDASFSPFYNTINNYIYQRNLNNEKKQFGNQWFPVYRFVQGNSLLKGFEFGINIHPVNTVTFENSLAYVNGTNLATNIPLPFIPAMHSRDEIRWYIQKGKSKSVFYNTFIKAGVTHTWKQDRYDIFETETGAYTLFNAGIGTDLRMGKQHLTVFINGENITNVKYYDHLNRFKILGIYNPGRNITFGIYFPILINQEK